MLIRKLLLSLILIIISVSLSAVGLIIRPEVGIGGTTQFNTHTTYLTQSYGGKVLMAITEQQRFGVKVDFLNLSHAMLPREQYLSVGILLEQVLFKYFHMGIGTVGYVNLHQKGNNPFVLHTQLGFEYPFANHFMVLAAYRADFVFSQHFRLANMFTLGVGYQLDFKKKK